MWKLRTCHTLIVVIVKVFLSIGSFRLIATSVETHINTPTGRFGMSSDIEATASMRTAVVYLMFPGTSESECMHIDARDVRKALDMAPTHALAFRFADIYHSSITVNGDHIEMVSKPVNISGFHFIDAHLLDAQRIREAVEVIPLYPGRAVRCRMGKIHEFNTSLSGKVSVS
jgi:hypothetical protein